VIAESLLELREHDLVFDADVHLMVEHWQGRQFLLGRDEQTRSPGRLAQAEHQQHSQNTTHGRPFRVKSGDPSNHKDEMGTRPDCYVANGGWPFAGPASLSTQPFHSVNEKVGNETAKMAVDISRYV